MAKIKTFEVRFDGRTIKLPLNCSSKGVFSIKLPEKMTDVLGIADVVESMVSIEDVENKFHELNSQFKAACTMERKVIVYRLELDAEIQTGKPGDEPLVFGDGTGVWSSQSGIRLNFAVGVFMETRTVSDRVKNDHTIYSRVEHSIPSSVQLRLEGTRLPSYENRARVIEWSPQAESFFIDFAHRFEDMVMRLNEFLGNDSSELLMEFIAGQEANLPLLPRPGE